MMQTFFRYRNIDSFLYKYHELENQEIFFATKKHENDVMEGWRPRFYKGGIDLWEQYWIKLFEFVARGIFDRLEEGYDEDHIKKVSVIVWERFKNNESVGKLLQEIDCNRKPIVQENLLNFIDFMRNYICYLVLLNLPFLDNDNKKEIELKLQIEEYMISGELGGRTRLYWEIYPQDLFINTEKEMIQYKDINVADVSSSRRFYEYIPRFAKDDIKEKLRKFYYSFPRDFMDYFNGIKEPLIGIASFSKKVDDLYMWAIYADQHRGVCLEFEIDDNMTMQMENGLLVHFYEVKYEDNPDWKNDGFNELGKVDNHITSVEWENCLGDIFERTHLIKSKYWEHEEEYRILLRMDTNSDDFKRKYKLENLKSITFGMWASNRSIIDTVEVLKKKEQKINILIYKMYQNIDGFKRKLVEVVAGQ